MKISIVSKFQAYWISRCMVTYGAYPLALSNVDYCNLLYAINPATSTKRLQSLINMFARFVSGPSRFDHIMDFTRDYLHWLPIRQRVDFKICSMVYKAQHDLSPNLHNGNDESDIHDSQTSRFKIGVSLRPNHPEAQN